MADAGKPSVQSLIDKFEQLAARASGRPGPVACGPRRRRVRCLSDCAPLLSGCDDLALRRHVLTKRSVDMTSTTSTTSISSDDEEDEEDVDVDESDDRAVDEPQAEADSGDLAVDREDVKDKPNGAPDAQEDGQQLEPPIVIVALPPIDETAAERPSDGETDAQELASDDRDEGHDAGCACSRCWLQQSAAHVADNQVEHEPAPSVAEDAATHSSHHDAPLTLEDLCTLHVASPRPAAATATKPLQPSKIPQPRFSYAARRASLGHNALASLAPTTDNAASRRNSLAAGARSRIPALSASTPSRRNSLAAGPSAAARGSSSAAGVQPTPSRSQTRRNSLAPIAASTSSSGSSSRRQSAPTISSNSVASGSSAATGKPRPRYLDYAQSPRFAALKAQNLERRRLAEEKSRALAAAAPAAKASPRRATPDAAASSASLALSSGSSLASSASASSTSLASSLPPRSTRRPELLRTRGLEHDAGRRPRRQLRSQSS